MQKSSSWWDSVALGIVSSSFWDLGPRQHLFGDNSPFKTSSCAYLQDRTQAVTANKMKSSFSLLTYGVPHGSVQGPVLFILYTQTLSDVRWWSFWLQLTECRMAFGWQVLNCTNLPILLKLSLCHGPQAASVSDVTVRVVRINFIWKTTDQTEIFVLGRTEPVRF